MNIKLVKSLNEELIEIIEEMQRRAENHSLTDEEFLESVRKIGKKNALILEEIGLPINHQ